jgi:hypothetical protein
LRSQLEEATSRRDQRVVDRNAYRTTYESLIHVIRQQQVTGEIQIEKITVTDPAIRANRTDVRGMLPPVLGGVAGLALGTFLSFLLEFGRRTQAGAAGRAPFHHGIIARARRSRIGGITRWQYW